MSSELDLRLDFFVTASCANSWLIFFREKVGEGGGLRAFAGLGFRGGGDSSSGSGGGI